MTNQPIGRIPLSSVDDYRLRIVMAMIRFGEPARQTDIATLTKLSPQLVDYHMKSLLATGVVIEVTDDLTAGRFYVLQEPFYDDTFMEGMAQALLPLARTTSESLEFDPHCGADPKDVMKETIRYMVNVFLCTVGRDLS